MDCTLCSFRARSGAGKVEFGRARLGKVGHGCVWNGRLSCAKDCARLNSIFWLWHGPLGSGKASSG